MLRTYGWRTAAFYPPAVFFVDAQKLKAYADTNFDFEYVKFEYLDAERRVNQVFAYYDEVKPPQSFVWVHFFEPHEPYESARRLPVRRRPTSIATTARSPTPTRRSAASSTTVRKRAPARRSSSWPRTTARSSTSTAAAITARRCTTSSCACRSSSRCPGVAPRVDDGPVELIDVTPDAC